MGKRPVLFTLDAFAGRRMGGVRRMFLELFRRLPATGRPCRLAAGFVNGHLPALSLGGLDVAWPLISIPSLRGADRLVRAGNRCIDWFRPSAAGEILHPTYFREIPARITNPVVVTVHDMTAVLFYPAAYATDIRIKQALIRRADMVIAVSESTRSDLVRILKIPHESIAVVHHGTGFDTVTANLVPELPTAPFLLWVGARGGHKNFAGAARGLARCEAARELRLVCAGGGTFQKDEVELLRELDLAARTMQIDLTDGQLAWAYAQTAALLYCSSYEGFGLPIVEAFARGAPVVASNTSSMPEVGGPHAIYVDPQSDDGIAAGIGQAIAQGREPALVSARRAWASRFTWERCATETDAVYTKLD